jgi:hypothetical protein
MVQFGVPFLLKIFVSFKDFNIKKFEIKSQSAYWWCFKDFSPHVNNVWCVVLTSDDQEI